MIEAIYYKNGVYLFAVKFETEDKEASEKRLIENLSNTTDEYMKGCNVVIN